MINNPDAFKKAQEEIDRVIGNDRLIDFDDKDSLPYFAAVLREVLRWVRFRSAVGKDGFLIQPPAPRWGCPLPLGEAVSRLVCDKSSLTST